MYLIIRTNDTDLYEELKRYAIDNGMSTGNGEQKYYSVSTIAENMEMYSLS